MNIFRIQNLKIKNNKIKVTKLIKKPKISVAYNSQKKF